MTLIPGAIGGRSIDAGGRLTVRSALNPLLWFCAVVDVPLITALLFIYKTSPDWLLIAFFTLIAIPILCTIFSAIFLLFVDRDKLQSEDYQIRKQTLDLIGQKGELTQSLGTFVEAISNPKLIKLPSGRRHK